MKIAFVDTETFGLDARLHGVWEIAAIVREEDGSETEHLWYPRPGYLLGSADPMSLRMTRYYERRRVFQAKELQPALVAERVADALDGCHIVGAVPSFDDIRLEKFLRDNGFTPSWHYHLMDVEAMMVGYLRGTRVNLNVSSGWKSDDLSRAIGVEPPTKERHTAMGDARWARDCYDVVMGYA